MIQTNISFGNVNRDEAPDGFYAVLKSDARPSDGSNICRACDWLHTCQNPNTDFSAFGHRCMPHAVITSSGAEIRRLDEQSVVFKRREAGKK